MGGFARIQAVDSGDAFWAIVRNFTRKVLVDGARIELATSALRTQRTIAESLRNPATIWTLRQSCTSHVRRVFEVCPLCRKVTDEKLEFAHNSEPLTKIADTPCPSCVAAMTPKPAVVH